MNILGLHLGHDATAALIVDNRLVSMIEKERLTRKKYDRGFMPEMVDRCLELGGIGFVDIDYVAVSLSVGPDESPDIRLDDLWGITITKDGKRYINGPRQLNWEYEDGITVRYEGIDKPAFQIQHHIAHAAASFYVSDFKNAISLTYDGSGPPDEQTSLICKCKDTKINVEGVPNMTGALLYGVICRFVFGSWRDSGKWMGLAAYGEPNYYMDKFMDDTSINGITKNLNKYWENPKEWAKLYKSFTTKIKDLAASTQKWMEENLKIVLNFIEKEYGRTNIIIGGGGALNVICNRMIYDRFPVFCTPFTKDDGLAAGGALYVLHYIMGIKRQKYTTRDITFLGNGDSSWEWTSSTQLHLKTQIDIKSIAQDLADGKVVLWHQGRSEVGPRALSHRSIFASPVNYEMKQYVSEHIKGRESYRPLAPIVLAEDCEEWFDVKPCAMTDLMLLNAKVKKPDLIPAVVHIDGTARVQTITKEFNPIVYDLLSEFKKLTGIPVLINTSLNIQGQAICDSERDTLWTFDNCDADICVINNEVHRKNKKEEKEVA